MYIEPWVSLTGGSNVDYNNTIDKSKVVPMGFTVSGNSAEYTIDDSSYTTPTFNQSQWVCVNGKLYYIVSRTSSGTRKSFINTTIYNHNTIIITPLTKSDGWLAATMGNNLTSNNSYWDFLEPDNIHSYTKVLLGMDGKYYTLSAKTTSSQGYYTYTDTVISGNGKFNGYIFRYTFNSNQHSYGYCFGHIENGTWVDYRNDVWCKFE